MPTTILDNETYPEALQRRYSEETKAEKQAEIIRMANKACQPHQILNTDLEFLIRFADLVAAHTLENDADLTIAYMKGGEDMKRRMEKRMQQLELQLQLCQTAVANEREACAKVCEGKSPYWERCAAAIRARGEK